ncbi:trypsin-like serine protease [Corynebacterium resistens]|uniref:trypsin-like serine protease n=1 Tax=Corynebacterium resistens TaxID=258224 RepID=UPI002355FB64|nr:trypsin-like serine protease [Corynebacterium resistens]
MRQRIFTVFAVAGITMLGTPYAVALENGDPAPDTEESRAVAALRIGRVGSFGDCTGTLVAQQWVLTARHCLESVRNEGTQARIAGQVYDADQWALSPLSDAALLHLTKPVTDVTPARIATEVPKKGQRGTLYGWSSSSSMARKGQLPKSEMEVAELLGGAPSVGGAGSDSHKGATPEGVESVPAQQAMPGAGGVQGGMQGGVESVPAEQAMPGAGAPAEGVESIPAQQALPAPGVGGSGDGSASQSMPAIAGSTILDVHATGRAGMQGGDSGGPFFVDGKLAGLATAGTSNGDPDLPSSSAAITTLAGTKDWVEGVTSGRDTKSVLTAETTPDPPRTPQTSADHKRTYLIVGLAGLIAAAVIARIPAVRSRQTRQA